jgi:hypothetical protein
MELRDSAEALEFRNGLLSFEAIFHGAKIAACRHKSVGENRTLRAAVEFEKCLESVRGEYPRNRLPVFSILKAPRAQESLRRAEERKPPIRERT